MWDPQKYSGRGFRRKEEAEADSGKDIRRVRAHNMYKKWEAGRV